MAIDHVSTHRVWIIITSVNVYLFSLFKLKFFAVWLWHPMYLCKSLYLCKYIRVITRCCLSMYLNSFLSSRTWGKAGGRFHWSPDSREPTTKVKGSSFLLFVISWLSLLTVLLSQILTHSFGKLSIWLKMQFTQQWVTSVVSFYHLG